MGCLGYSLSMAATPYFMMSSCSCSRFIASVFTLTTAALLVFIFILVLVCWPRPALRPSSWSLASSCCSSTSLCSPPTSVIPSIARFAGKISLLATSILWPSRLSSRPLEKTPSPSSSLGTVATPRSVSRRSLSKPSSRSSKDTEDSILTSSTLASLVVSLSSSTSSRRSSMLAKSSDMLSFSSTSSMALSSTNLSWKLCKAWRGVKR